MGTTKTEQYTATDLQLAEIAKALGHPARIAIMRVLLQKCSCVCGDIVDELPLAQATVSQHLKELKKVGLLRGDVEGPRVCYCINTEVWNRAKASLNSFFVNLDANGKCC